MTFRFPWAVPVISKYNRSVWHNGKQPGFRGFDHAITGAIYFTFYNGKKSSFDRLNYRSIQVFYFEISVKKKRRKEIPIDKRNFFS